MVAKYTRLTHKNNDTTAPSGRELYHLQFSLLRRPVLKLLDTPSYTRKLS